MSPERVSNATTCAPYTPWPDLSTWPDRLPVILLKLPSGYRSEIPAMSSAFSVLPEMSPVRAQSETSRRRLRASRRPVAVQFRFRPISECPESAQMSRFRVSRSTGDPTAHDRLQRRPTTGTPVEEVRLDEFPRYVVDQIAGRGQHTIERGFVGKPSVVRPSSSPGRLRV